MSLAQRYARIFYTFMYFTYVIYFLYFLVLNKKNHSYLEFTLGDGSRVNYGVKSNK